MKKKITHIINGLDLGGAETALYRLLLSMQGSNYEYSVIVLGEAGHYSPNIEALGIPIHYLGVKKKPFIKAFYCLIVLIRQIQPDIVQTWLYHSDLIGGLSAKLCGIKKIIWGIRCEGIGLKKTTKRIQQLCALMSWIVPDFIIANSQRAADNHRQAGYNYKKIHVIPNGFDSAIFSQNRDTTFLQNIINKSLPLDALFIGTLARFHNDKDYPNLVQAIDMICKLHHNIYFVLCGPGCNDENSEFVALLNTLEHREHVILIDGIDDSVAYLNALDIFVLTSKTEAFPNSLAEAMLCELPCIATDVGEVREIMGNTGLLIPSQDPQALAAACSVMIKKSKKERQQLGHLAREKIEEKYSMAKNRLKVSAIYEQLI